MEQSRNRLPSLFEALSRRTLPPVDLFSFYIYMRDQQRSVDYLDFWLDIAQHMSLCRLYVRELRRSMLVSTPDLIKENESKHSSLLLEQLAIAHEPSEADSDNDQRLSAFLRDDTSSSVKNPYHKGYHESPTSRHSDQRDEVASSSTESSPTQTVGRQDIRASAERILYSFLIPGSEREIVLPAHIIRGITTAIEVEGRDDPEVFDEAKDYVFQAMERDAFPGFLRAKALGNLVPASVMLRLVLGLLAMFGGFWTSFALIFLDTQPKTTRLWIILPFSIGVYALVAHQYDLDPLLAFAGLSESTFLSFMRVREPYIRKVLHRRALWEMVLIVVVVAALVVLFTLVPGHRL